jgi:hypothetical protein
LVTIFEGTAIISAGSAIFVSIFAVIQLRHMEKHRNVDVTMKLFEWADSDRLHKAFRWLDKEYSFKTYADYKLLEQNDVTASEYPFEVVAFFEQVGFLVQKKFVDHEVVADRLGHYVVLNWRKLSPWIEGVRKEKRDPTYGEHFEHLYNRTAKYLQKRCDSGESKFCTEQENTPN